MGRNLIYRIGTMKRNIIALTFLTAICSCAVQEIERTHGIKIDLEQLKA